MGEVAIPVWLLLLAWAIVGHRAAVRGQNALLTAGVTGRPKLAARLLQWPAEVQYTTVALAAAAAGPFVWVIVLQEAVKELGARIRRALSRGGDDV